MSAAHDQESAPTTSSATATATAEVEELGGRAVEGPGAPVTVRRNAGLAAVIGGAASAIAIAYLWRATETGSVVDWVLCGALAVLAVFYLATLLDARTPLMVADALGVRIRLGRQWRGLPWDAVASVEVQSRRSAVSDGRLVFRPCSMDRALEGLESGGRRAARLNQRMYGGALAVPVGLTTRASAGFDDLGSDLVALSGGRISATPVAPRPTSQPTAEPTSQPTAEPAPEPAPAVAAPADKARAATRTPAVTAAASNGSTAVALPVVRRERPRVGGLATIWSRAAKARSGDRDPGADLDIPPATTPATAPPATTPGTASGTASGTAPETARVSPLRLARPGLRAQVTRDVPATPLGPAHGAAVLQEDPAESGRSGPGLPRSRELRRPGSVALVFEPAAGASVHPIAELGEPVEPLVLGDFVTEPAYDPVIGPELAAARTRVGLSVDELSDRTRIRPHVIEAIEVDDFAPCGGDFYVRGHLRTLARVLGQDPAPMLASFEDRYASAPVNARRVFEAELATGMGRRVRNGGGGPNWGLLVGAVLCLVMAWGVIRLFEADPQQLVPAPMPLNGSAGVDQDPDPRLAPLTAPSRADQPATTRPLMSVTLVANEAATDVVARDGDGDVVYSGALVLGERMSLRVEPPLTLRAEDAGAVTVRVGSRDRGPVGVLGQPGTRTYYRLTGP